MKLIYNNELKYNIFIFLSTFARGLCEIFVPIVLYNRGFSLTCIFAYFVIKYFVLSVNQYPIIMLGKKVKFKWLLVISSFALGISFYYLSIIALSLQSLIFVALSFGIFTQTYWLGRHYYAMEVLPRKNMGDEVGNIIILSQLALIPSAYLGGLAIEFFGLRIVAVIITFISLMAIFPIFSIKERKNTLNINISNVFKTIPKQSLAIIAIDQFRLAIMLLFPLLIFMNIAQTYRYIGILHTAIGLASLFFIYVFARRMDQDKNDYLNIAVLLLGLIFLIKLNVLDAVVMVVVAILEGLVSRMHLTSLTRNIYSLGKNYDVASYLVIYETFSNIPLVLIFTFGLLFINNLSMFLYIATFLFLVAGFVKFNDGKGGY